jgi:GWxTD domain-containing protein
MLKRAAISCVLLVVLGRAVSAQAPADRARLDSLRAMLAGIADSTVLLAREQAGIARAKQDRDNALIHLELGYLAYRIGEVTANRKHFDDAAGEFEWAGELQPNWPHAWYGLGLAELAIGEQGGVVIENLKAALGMDALSKAARAFARAAAADPAFAVAVVELAETARRQRIHQRLAVVQNALRAAVATEAGTLPAVQLARGRVERDLGEGDSALVAFRAYVAVGGDSALGLLEQARTLFFLRRIAAGSAAYFAGTARVRDSIARAEYRDDLAWIATPEELAQFDALAVSDLSPWLARFWAGRDAASGRASGERLGEHYRRLFYAWHQFRLTSPRRQYTLEPYRSDQGLLDDRGVIYIRQGEPDERARYLSPDVEPNESWLYRRPDGNLIFHFVARGDVQDFKLIESLADVYGFGAGVSWQARDGLPPGAAALFESRGNLDPRYRRLATSATALQTELTNERRRGRRAIQLGTTTDGFPLRFDQPLHSRTQVYVVGGSEETAQLLFVFAVPGAQLAPRTLGDKTVYPLELRLVQRAGDAPPSFLDTTRLFLTAQPVSGDQYLTGYLEVPIEPGLRTLRAVVMDPDGSAGDIGTVDSVLVPDFSAEGLVVSDLVLGDLTSGLRWVAAGDTVHLSPLGSYVQGSSLELYYELHGLPVGTPYRARIEVRGRRGTSIFARIGRLFGGGRPPVAFSFDGRTTARPTRAHQTVNLAPLGPGEYTLTLTVEDPSRDVRHRRDVRFRVVAR